MKNEEIMKNEVTFKFVENRSQNCEKCSIEKHCDLYSRYHIQQLFPCYASEREDGKKGYWVIKEHLPKNPIFQAVYDKFKSIMSEIEPIKFEATNPIEFHCWNAIVEYIEDKS